MVPTATVFAKILDIKERSTSARLKRLIDACPEDFSVVGRVRRINYDKLATESETTELLCSIQIKLGGKDSISVEEILAILIEESGFKTEEYLEALCRAGYLEPILAKKSFISIR